MVESVLSIIQLIVVLFVLVLIFWHRNEKRNKLLRLILLSILFFISLFELPLLILNGKPYIITIFLVVIWYINGLLTVNELNN